MKHLDLAKAGYIRSIAMLEMKKRGVRFLPLQVIKRAVRKHQSAQPKKSTYFSDKPFVEMGGFPMMTLEEDDFGRIISRRSYE